MTLSLPLRIVRHDESLEIRTSDGRAVAYLYFEDEPTRRATTNRLSREDATKAAKIMARALRDSAGE